MVPFKRPFLADEELGKKDDDHRLQPVREPLWRARQWRAPRPRRFLVAVIALYLLYLFFKNMPTDIPPAVERFNQAQQKNGKAWPPPMPSPVTPVQSPPPRDESRTESKEEFYYEGDIRFSALDRSLQRFWKPPARYGRTVSRAVVFAGSNLQGISDLLPLACRMAGRKENEVHFVLMGRDDVSIEGIQRVNGIGKTDCPINWHDGRPDYAQWSTGAHMEKAVAAAIGLVQVYTHPHVLITRGDPREDPFFTKGIQKNTRETGLTHIALPGAARDVMWISMLDSNALKAWNEVHVEILIQAQSESSGSLIRLIRSLEAADYLGSIPSLTIELPPRVDSQLLRFLQKMKWPPLTSNSVTLRRRIQPHRIDAVEASLRTVEAFYPRNPDMTHVLLLNPQTEVAPSFYHYLKYTMLKYKHSTHTKLTTSNLLGISLELPSSRLTDNEPLNPPAIDNSQLSQQGDGEPLPMFLWQAPNSNAALYFGDKWVEFHSFLTNRLALHHPTSEDPSYEKVISKKYPAVMEYLLELIRARGYYLLYPAFPNRGPFTLATVHNELYQPPEEYLQDVQPNSGRTPAGSDGDWESIENPLHQASTLMPLLDRFSFDLPDLSRLPLLSYRGEQISDAVYSQDTEEYTKKFRVRYGGCQDSTWKADSSPTTLFCLNDKLDAS